jgi:hypothetical protein
MIAAICLIWISLAAAAAREPAAAAALSQAEVDAALAFTASQLQRAVEDFPPGGGTLPGRHTNPDGSWPAVDPTNWVAGASRAGAAGSHLLHPPPVHALPPNVKTGAGSPAIRC